MNVKLAVLCAFLWGAGFLGMILARVLDLEPGELPFDVSARVCVIGWLTYGLLAVLHVTSAGEAAPKPPARRRSDAPSAGPRA